jgi:cyclopropane fatty-acyl-phospholipid synthase-like methyltransferase
MCQIMTLAEDVARYYAARAHEYDESAGYTDPVAEERRAEAKARYVSLFRDRDVLEIGCGTGYWTSVISQQARSVTATDVNGGMLAIARERLRRVPHVRFQEADAYSLKGLASEFTAACAIWWWSHMPRDLWTQFLTALHARLVNDALVLIVDQLPSAYTPQNRRRLGRDWLEDRVLQDGTVFTVVKNFPNREELSALLRDHARDVEYVTRRAENAWELTYRLCRAVQAG